MEVLEELKRIAEKVQAERLRRESAEDPSATLERRLVTRVDDLYHYFKELQKHLSVASPEVWGDFYVPDLCTLTNLKQENYQVHTEDTGDVRQFTFHYTCVGKGSREIRFPNSILAETKKDRLLRNNLKFRLRENAGGTCSIIIEAFVPVSFKFKADFKKAAVRLRVKNKPMLGLSQYSYGAGGVNAEFMDEVALYILDKPNRFDELSGNTIPENTLVRLREQLDREKRRRKGKKARLKEFLSKPLFGGKP